MAKDLKSLYKKYLEIKGDGQNMADGGKVEHDHKNILELKKAFDKFIGEEGTEKGYASGGVAVNPPIQSVNPERHAALKEMFPKWDDAKIESYLQSQMPAPAPRELASLPAVPAPIPQPIPKRPIAIPDYMSNQGGTQNVNSGDLAGNVTTQLDERNVGNGMYQGGEAHLFEGTNPVTGNIDPNSPEGLAMISGAAYPSAPQVAPSAGVPDADPFYVQGATPAKESSMEESPSPDDKELEEEVANEDFEAGEKAEDGKQRKTASEKDDSDEDDSDDDDGSRKLEGMTLNHDEALKQNPEEKDMVAGLQVNPDLQKLIDAQKHQPNDLEKAQKDRDQQIALQQMEKSAALLGAGIAGRSGARVDPSQQIKLISDNDKYVGLPVQKYGEQLENQQHDPNSPMSKVVKDYMASKGLKVPPGASASDLYKIAPFLAKDQALQNAIQKVVMQQKGAADRNAATNTTREKGFAAADKRAAEHNDILKQTLADKKENTKLAKAQKSTNDQNKALTQTQQMLESARGNPGVSQAEKDLYSAQKVNSLIDLVGDPNKMSNQQVNLLISEVGKIATGGVPTGHEQEALKPGTGASHLASLWSKMTNEPTPANAGAFIKQFQDYNNALSKDAQKVIQDKYGRVIESRKNQLGDDNYKSLQDHYINRFKPVANEIPVDADLSKLSPAELKDYIKRHGAQ